MAQHSWASCCLKWPVFSSRWANWGTAACSDCVWCWRSGIASEEEGKREGRRGEEGGTLSEEEGKREGRRGEGGGGDSE